MSFIKSVLVLGLLSISALAAPLTARQSGSNGATCGSNSYDASAVSAAQQQGCQLQQGGQTVGRNKYPHSENNYEHLTFIANAPFFEFPIMADGSIFDGSAGPSTDRVVFNDQCQLAGLVTHSGASGNNFVMCDWN